MTTNARKQMSHKDCTHPKTREARRACREGREFKPPTEAFSMDHSACAHDDSDKAKIECHWRHTHDMPVKDGQRKCSDCSEWKPLDQFSRDSSMPSGYRRRCKDCAQVAKWKRLYGITREEYDELLEAQGGGCWICGTTDPGIEGRGFSVDHCHGSEVVRGLLDHHCNVNLVPGFERLISMGLDPVAAIEKYLAQPRVWGKYTENAYWREDQQRWALKPKFRAQIMAEHDGTCDLCGAEEPEGNGWHIDHDHLTDEIRGIVDFSCNRMLGGADRLLELGIPLERVVEYLQQDTGIKTTAVAKKIVAYSKTERRKESQRASRRRRAAKKRDEEAS